MEFVKYHGIGNDFILIEDPAGSLLTRAPFLAKKLCQRNTGIGADGLVLLTHNPYGMRIFNSDGSEAEMCGNAIRCVADYLREKNYVTGDSFPIQSQRGIHSILVKEDQYEVDMGEPLWERDAIPIKTDHPSSLEVPVMVFDSLYKVSGVSMGNPHGVVFVSSMTDQEFQTIGSALSNHPLFPAKANIEFVEVKKRDHLEVRVWERGVGPTLACGTGACASLAVAFRLGLSDSKARVSLPGGCLFIEVGKDQHMRMRGPATKVFVGNLRLEGEKG